MIKTVRGARKKVVEEARAEILSVAPELFSILLSIARDPEERSPNRIAAVNSLLERAIPKLMAVEFDSDDNAPSLPLSDLARWLAPGATQALPPETDAEVIEAPAAPVPAWSRDEDDNGEGA